MLAQLIHQPTGTAQRMWHVRAKGKPLGTSVPQLVTFKRICLGFGGKPCKKKAHLKSNSSGDLCAYCRDHIISSYVYIPAVKARRAIQFLNKRGLGLRAIEEVSGLNRKTLVLIRSGKRKRVTKETEEALLDMVETSVTPEAPVECSECGLSHQKQDRLARLRRMLPCTVKELREAYPCTYPYNERAERMLYRDLEDLRASNTGGLWCITSKEGAHG